MVSKGHQMLQGHKHSAGTRSRSQCQCQMDTYRHAGASVLLDHLHCAGCPRNAGLQQPALWVRLDSWGPGSLAQKHSKEIHQAEVPALAPSKLANIMLKGLIHRYLIPVGGDSTNIHHDCNELAE